MAECRLYYNVTIMKISVIGAGAMGGALANGLLKCGKWTPESICVADPSTETLAAFAAKGAATTSDNRRAVAGADVVFVVVKPWIVQGVLEEISPVVDCGRQSVVVIAAGVSARQVMEWAGNGQGVAPRLFLAIPNTAISELCSMTFVVSVNATEAETASVCALFDELGTTIVTEERLLPAATTLASCGIAYAMRYIRAASEGGVELGFRATDATKIVAQTVKGAVSLLEANGNHPEAEIDKVTTPGGVTIKGLNEMEHAGFTSAVIRGLKAGLGKQ